MPVNFMHFWLRCSEAKLIIVPTVQFVKLYFCRILSRLQLQLVSFWDSSECAVTNWYLKKITSIRSRSKFFLNWIPFTKFYIDRLCTIFLSSIFSEFLQTKQVAGSILQFLLNIHNWMDKWDPKMQKCWVEVNAFMVIHILLKSCLDLVFKITL